MARKKPQSQSKVDNKKQDDVLREEPLPSDLASLGLGTSVAFAEDEDEEDDIVSGDDVVGAPMAVRTNGHTHDSPDEILQGLKAEVAEGKSAGAKSVDDIAAKIQAAPPATRAEESDGPKPSFTVTLPAPPEVLARGETAAALGTEPLVYSRGKLILPMPTVQVRARDEGTVVIESPDAYTVMTILCIAFHATVRGTLLLRQIFRDGEGVFPKGYQDLGLEGFNFSEGNVWTPHGLIVRPKAPVLLRLFNPSSTPYLTVGGGLLVDFERLAPPSASEPEVLRIQKTPNVGPEASATA